MNARSFRVISWNARSHNRRRSTIDKLLTENNVIMIQEAKLRQKPSYPSDIRVFFQPTSEGRKAKRGLLILANKEVDCCQIETPRNPWGVEVLAIPVQIEGTTHILVNLYVPCDSMATMEQWEKLINSLVNLGPRVVIAGDFNARSQVWTDVSSNVNGKALEAALPSIGGILLNNDGPTRVAERPGDSDSCIDLTMVSPLLAMNVKWKTLPLMGSDHKPILIHLVKGGKPQRAKNPPGFQYRTRGSSIVHKVRRQVREAGSRRPKKPVRQKPRWWTEEVEETWNEKLSRSREYSAAKSQKLPQQEIKQRRSAFNEAAENFQETSRKNKQHLWDSFCCECDPWDMAATSKFWTLAKEMKRCSTGDGPSPQLIKGLAGEPLRTDREKGEAFLARYQSQLQPDGPAIVKQAKAEVDQRLLQETGMPADPPVTLEELESTLQAIPKDSAPGPDGVRYSDLKAMSIEEKIKLLSIINSSLQEGHLDDDLRDCRMVVLPKPMKDHCQLKGYRIITMANAWVKIVEKIAAQRLSQDLESRNCFSARVGGARPRRTTVSNVEAILHEIQQGMQTSKHTAVALFDLEDAYNKVDVGILSKKMWTMGVSDQMIRWILALLDTRRCQLGFGKWKSGIFEVSSGLPQGSPLSSILFNVYTADLVDAVETKMPHPTAMWMTSSLVVWEIP